MLFGKPKRIVKRILIVEDEPLTAFDNETMLEELGYTVVATHDRVKEALATLEREKVDLIMSDVKLAGDRSGIELARIAKDKGVPVLFATGMVPDEAVELAVGCLIKPYSLRTLKTALAAVDQHLQGAKAKPPKGLILYE
ncbi:MAG TPA: response regulator [Sphingomicrobium sp.]|jgi:CheY-like chemotaxis protein|nr:response regulator [Sphingomicrobium sp.]